MSDRLPNGQFPPGISGNPGGMVKGRSITKLLRLILDGDAETWAKVRQLEAPGAPDDLYPRLRVAVSLYRRALVEMAAMRELLDRVDGKLAAAYALPDDDGPAQILRPVLYVAPDDPAKVQGLVRMMEAAGPVPEDWKARPALAPEPVIPALADEKRAVATTDRHEPFAALVEVAPGPKDRT